MNSNTKTLSDLHSNAEIFVASKQQRIADRAITSQLNKIGHKERVNTFCWP